MSETLQSDDYISLGRIKGMFLDVFRFIFKVFDFVIFSIRRSLVVFLFCCVVGLLGGYLYYSQSPRYFETEMIVQSTDLSRRTYYEIIKNLNDLIATQSHANFASQLKIDEQLSKQVLRIEAIGLNDEELSKDTVTKVGMPLKIALKTSSNAQISSLQKGILYYLNNNSYLRLTKESQKRIYLERLAFINEEQNRLDSLKTTFTLALGSMKMPATFYNNALNPADIYVYSSDLLDQKEKILKWLNNESQAVLVIDGFKSQMNPQSVPWPVPLLIGLTAGVVLGILLCLLTELKRSINKS